MSSQMSNDIDIEQFAKILDAALSSNNPSMKKALKNFLLVASIVESENTNNLNTGFVGFSSILEEIKILHKRILALEYQKNSGTYYSSTPSNEYNTGEWKYYSNTSSKDYYLK